MHSTMALQTTFNFSVQYSSLGFIEEAKDLCAVFSPA